MAKLPERCRSWKVANWPLTAWWCRGVCGPLNGKLCVGWCRIVQRYGLWTLWITLGVPAVVLAVLIWLAVR